MSGELLADHVIGYRAWRGRRRGNQLRALAMDKGAWERGENTATCHRGSSHDAPGQDCACGIYAFHNLARARGPVVGAIRAWGAVEVHRDGFRAQFAEIVALGYYGVFDRREARRLARAYGVPAVPIRRLRKVALENGSPVPAHLRPGGGDNVSLVQRAYTALMREAAGLYLVALVAIHPSWWWAQTFGGVYVYGKARHVYRWLRVAGWRDQ